MASDRQLELRVSRLENDTNSIYELITEIRSTQQEHSQRLDKLETTFAVRFDQMETRFETMETRFETMETRFEKMETRFEKMETSTAARFDKIETTLTEVLRRLPEPA